VGCSSVELSTPVLAVYQPASASQTLAAATGSSAVKWLNRKVADRVRSVSPMRLVLRAVIEWRDEHGLEDGGVGDAVDGPGVAGQGPALVEDPVAPRAAAWL
jgi:hypothetical protein